MEYWQMFTRLTLSLSLYRNPPWQLTPEQLADFEQRYARHAMLESRIEEQAARWGISAAGSDIAAALDALDGRAADQPAWPLQLARLGLDRNGLCQAMSHQVLVEKTLAQVASQAPSPDERQVEAWYRQHQAQFVRPEQRCCSHILLTVDEDQPDCRPDQVRRRINAMHQRLCDDIGRFTHLAQRHSHCPTALDGGNLGWVSRGLLFESLDNVLFAMDRQRISDVVTSPIGLHILYCRDIRPAAALAPDEALAAIRRQFQDKMQRQHQRLWLQALCGASQSGAAEIAPYSLNPRQRPV